MIYGMVTGWGFKLQTMIMAKTFHISGSVSEHTGSLEIHAEGKMCDLSEFTDWCYKGPIASKAESITVEEEGLSYFDEFSIK